MNFNRGKEKIKQHGINSNDNINYNNENVILDEEGNIDINDEDDNLTFAKEELINKKEPSYVMTIELEKGKSDNIQIYIDSSSDELAFDFCKKNNLNLKAMQFLSGEINKLLAKITIQSKIVYQT